VSSDRIVVRAYYRDKGGFGPCALRSEKHRLEVSGLAPGRYTFVGAQPGVHGKTAELTVVAI
jgi:hypothetical protein